LSWRSAGLVCGGFEKVGDEAPQWRDFAGAEVDGIRYSHDERLAGLSDHSPLILELGV
jgi:hypothetical protein